MFKVLDTYYFKEVDKLPEHLKKAFTIVDQKFQSMEEVCEFATSQ
jgi:hypothetical protein